MIGRRAGGAVAVAVVLFAACKRSPDTVAPHPIAYYRGVETGPSGAPVANASASPALPPPRFDDGVTVHLHRVAPGGDAISFALPLPPRAVKNVAAVRVTANGAAAEARVFETLPELDGAGLRIGARALKVELPSASLGGQDLDVHVRFGGDGLRALPAAPRRSFAETSADSAEDVVVATRTLVRHPQGAVITTSPPTTKRLFVGREPVVLATYPEGYLAATRILGAQTTTRGARDSAFAGMRFLSEEAIRFGGSAIYDEPYPLDPDPDSVPDPKTAYEGWLYDRCATLLLLYTHSGQDRFLRHGLRACSWYARQIKRDGPNAGTFAGKTDADPKYSHARGLYAYYALTGDEEALAAARAIAEMWNADKLFVIPYQEGHVRGPDKLWTERLLGTSLEGLLYGHLFTGEKKYLDGVRQLVDTAHRHVTGDAKDLAAINPGATFPPQGCFIHSAAQQAEGAADRPWCSSWMSELLVDALLRYQEQTADPRPDAIFVQLSRFLRDVGTAYFRGNVLDDRFLAPSFCDDPQDTADRRRLVPLYGAGVDASGARKTAAEYTDSQHCADATALTAVALRALRRRGEYDKNPVAPFKSEGDALLALHGELAFCAEVTFREETRTKRNPDRWSPSELAPGLADPPAFLKKNKIGFPQRNLSPQRKLSWWLNASLEQWAVLADAGVTIPILRPGSVAGPPCRR